MGIIFFLRCLIIGVGVGVGGGGEGGGAAAAGRGTQTASGDEGTAGGNSSQVEVTRGRGGFAPEVGHKRDAQI